MKVALTTDGVFPQVVGGMARHSCYLARNLAAGGADVWVFHPGPKPAFDDAQIREVLVEMPSHRHKGHYIRETWEYSKRIAAALQRSGTRFEAGYAQGTTMWALWDRKNFPAIVNPHGLEMFQAIGRGETLRALPFRWIMRTQMKRADKVVSLGGRLTDLIKIKCEIPVSKIAVLPNAIEVSYVDSMAPRNVDRIPGRLLFVGRLFPNKGAPQMIEAVNGLADSSVSLDVVGTGPLEAELRKMVRHPGINFRGALPEDELFRSFGRAEALILPTLGEGMPTVILEAMACRLPIIASDVGAVSELVDDTNGKLVAPGDVESLRSAIAHVLTVPREQRIEMGASSRRKVEERFDWEPVAEKTLDVLESLVDERG